MCSRRYLDENEVDRFLQLVSNGRVQINCISHQSDDSPILSICRHYRGDNLYLLLKAMLDRPDIDLEANCTGENSLTLLCSSTSYRLADCVQLLIENGVRVETDQGNEESNALLILSKFQCGAQLLEVARILVTHMSLDELNSVSQKVVDVLIERGLSHESLALNTLMQSERAALSTNRVTLDNFRLVIVMFIDINFFIISA